MSTRISCKKEIKNRYDVLWNDFLVVRFVCVGRSSWQKDVLSSLYRHNINANIYLFCFLLSSQVIRTLCYAAKLASALNVDRHPDAANKFKIFSSKMSQTRATLRLFDDLPMLQCTLQYGLGKHEPDRTLSVIGVITNIFDTIYYPIDKTCWLAEHKLLHVENPTLWDTLSSLFWLLSNYLNLIK